MNHTAARGSEGSSGEQVQQRMNSIVAPLPPCPSSKKTPKQGEAGPRESGCDTALPAREHGQEAERRFVSPPRARPVPSSAPSAADASGTQVPADPITRPTNQACESTNAHRHRCRDCAGGGEGRGGDGDFVFFPWMRPRYASSNTLTGCLRWRGRAKTAWRSR